MTGYASERRTTNAGDLFVSLRSVNHRGLDLHFHCGHEVSAFENQIRALLKRKIERGHVEVRASLIRSVSEGAVAFNRQALARCIAAFRKAADEFHLVAEPDLNVLFTVPGVLAEMQEDQTLPAPFEGELLEAFEHCAAAFNGQREREGDALREEMKRQVTEVERWAGEIRALREQALPQFQARLREKLTELLGGSTLSEARVAEEAALLADRSDIQEEVVRLGVHTAELNRLLDEGGAVGKRIDFLLQEMNREVNTALAKSANAGEPGLQITTLGLATKANIERIREQGLNLE